MTNQNALFALKTTNKDTRYIIWKTSTFSLLLLCTRLYYKDKNILCRRPIEPLKDEERDNHLFPVADICSWRSLTNHFFNAIDRLYLQNRWNILEVTSLGLWREQRVLWKNVHIYCILNYLKRLKTETCRMFFINLFLIYYMYIKKVLLSLLASVQLYYNFFCEVKWYPWPKICIMYFAKCARKTPATFTKVA